MDLATPTGLEPATSAVTGRRANQLRYGALMVQGTRIPNGIRTRAAAVKGRSPGPLDDGDPAFAGAPAGCEPGLGVIRRRLGKHKARFVELQNACLGPRPLTQSVQVPRRDDPVWVDAEALSLIHI